MKKESNSIVRTRIAPSPTGPQMHIGNFRTALYCYFWAKKNNGEFILRVEDTDRKRYVKGSVEGYLKLFKDFKIEVNRHPSKDDIANMDEPILPPTDWIKNKNRWKGVIDSDYENKCIQTQRLPLYLKYALELIEKGYAYLCFLTEDELEIAKSNNPKNQPFRSPYRKYKQDEISKLVESGKPYVVRLNVEKFIDQNKSNYIEYTDLVLGHMKFDLNTVDDQVLVKSNGIPTYHLAVVIDDHNMDINFPFRGYGWLPSTPKQIMLYRMFGWEMPPFGHVTDVLDPAGGKLSKRKGAVFTTEFLKQGYLPEAIINFISLVGWTPKIERLAGIKERELFSLDEIIDLFEIEGISKTNAIFDRNKLIWFNKQYLSKYDNFELAKVFKSWVQEYQESCEYNTEIINDLELSSKIMLTKERADTLLDILSMIQFFYKKPQNINLEMEQTSEYVEKINPMLVDILGVMESLPEDTKKWEQKEWVERLRKISAEYSCKSGDSFMLLRLAIVGEPYSPPLFEAMQILGKSEVIERIKSLIEDNKI